MYKIRETIRSLYPINLLEGEGVGTSYEYFVKLRKLERFINTIGPVRRVLIAGLPERYGLSMDFFLLGQLLDADVVVRDERAGILERARLVFEDLKDRNVFRDMRIEWENVTLTERLDGADRDAPLFDLALSCEVIQRLKNEQSAYALNLMKLAGSWAVFAPNHANESHAKISGLKGLRLEALLGLFRPVGLEANIFDQGYIDLPPFPPGISRSEEKRAKASQSRLESAAMKGLEVYGRFESMIPQFLSSKMAHIVYVFGQRNPLYS